MTSFMQKLPLFPTAVIGSLPRPPWLLDLLSEYLAGRLTSDEWERACDRAVPSNAGSMTPISSGLLRMADSASSHVRAGMKRKRSRPPYSRRATSEV